MGKPVKSNEKHKSTVERGSEKKNPKDEKSKKKENKTKEKKKSIEAPKNVHDKKDKKIPNKSSSKENSDKKNVKNEHKTNHSAKEVRIAPVASGREPCFLCFCCGNNEDERLNEILLEEERLLEERKRKEEEEARRRKEEEEARIRKEEEERRLKEEEKRKEEEKKLREELEKEQLESLKKEDELKKKAPLKKIDIKPKQPVKKAQINFTSSAAAPPPPSASECEGPPKKVKETSVELSQGAYLVYTDNNNGQLEIRYSKDKINENGVLAYIDAANMPAFYFNKPEKKDILIKNAANLLQSTYIKDRISYYEKWMEFIKLQKTLNGTLYLLPAFKSTPPAMVDIIFYSSQQKKLQFAPIEEPVKIWGDYIFVIQHGLEIFNKEVNVDVLTSYVNSFGCLSVI